jgi:hypothetical protein
MAGDDIFENALNLEENSYTEGFTQGVTDGAAAGRDEGRFFGYQKGFEKFLEMGQIHGRAQTWSSRLDSSGLSPLPANPRLEKSVQSLLALTNPSDIPIENSETAVDDFDERMKKARSKVKIIERMIGEASTSESQDTPGAERNIEDFGLKSSK